MGFARAASVLENVQISLTAEDPISRNVAGRIWNLASATSDKSGLDLIETPEHPREGDTAVIVLSTQELPDGSKVANLTTDDIETLPQRLRTTCESTPNNKTPVIRLELPHGLGYDGTFTVGDAQTFAVMLLDAICLRFLIHYPRGGWDSPEGARLRTLARERSSEDARPSKAHPTLRSIGVSSSG